jgi:hypothetical protein
MSKLERVIDVLLGKAKIISQSPTKRLTEKTVIRALNFHELDETWLALMQTIDDMKEEAASNAAAQTVMGNSYGAAAYSGGWEHLDTLRQRLGQLREQAKQAAA